MDGPGTQEVRNGVMAGPIRHAKGKGYDMMS